MAPSVQFHPSTKTTMVQLNFQICARLRLHLINPMAWSSHQLFPPVHLPSTLLPRANIYNKCLGNFYAMATKIQGIHPPPALLHILKPWGTLGVSLWFGNSPFPGLHSFTPSHVLKNLGCINKVFQIAIKIPASTAINMRFGLHYGPRGLAGTAFVLGW
jgi:hypothetical protein